MKHVWTKVLSFSLVLFLIRITDAVVSFWAPTQIQATLHNSVLLGLIISFQSLVGLTADLIFPKLLKTMKVRRLIYLAIIFAASTSLLLVSTTVKPFVFLFLITMTSWGIYYELMAFGTYQFVDNAVPLPTRSAAWAIMDIFKNLAYMLGPLIAAVLLLQGYISLEVFIIVILVIAGILLTFSKKSHDTSWNIDVAHINPWLELHYWGTLLEYVWPIIVMTLITGFIDATIWTTGVIWTAKLIQVSSWGSLLIPLYQLPPLFLGLIVARMGIYKGKKIAAEKMILVAGLVLTCLVFAHTIFWQLLIILIASIALSFAYPLLEGVYSDIVARMGKEKKHLIGLNSSVVNMSFIIWPPIAGFIALRFGEQMTFVVTGGLVAVAAFILLFITPKKLKLPQSEIKEWG